MNINNFRKLFLILLFAPCACNSAETPLNANPIFFFDSPYKDSFVSYSLYSKGSMKVLRVVAPIGKEESVSILYDIHKREVLLREEYNNIDSKHLKYKTLLINSNLERIPHLTPKYSRELGSYYDLDRNKLLFNWPGKCSSPFDGYIGRANQPEKIEKWSLLLDRNQIHSASAECNRMAGQAEVHMPVASMVVSRVWKLGEHTYMIGLQYPAIIFMDSDLNLIKTAGFVVASYSDVKDILESDKLYSKWTNVSEPERDPFHVLVANEVLERYFSPN